MSAKHKRMNSALGGSPGRANKSGSFSKKNYETTPSKVYQKDWIQEKK